jgi:glycosyltransferase involved in cell wall biosynthesis
MALGPETPSLRLAVLSPCCYIGGAERWVMDLLDVLPREIRCAGVAIMYEETSSAAAIRELRKRAEVVGFGVEPARKLLRQADVCISWGMMPLAECLRDFRGRRIVVIHGSDTGYSSRVVESAVACRAELVGISRATLIPCGSHPARVIRSGVSPERVHCPAGAGQRLRASLGISDGDLLVGFVGRLSQEKRLPVLIEAIGLLPPQFHALLVGDGFDTAELKRLAAPMGRRVLFLPGRLDVAPVYGALDYFYCGSPSEGLPYTVLEAALAGIPLISTRVGALVEIAEAHGVLWTELPADPTPQDVARAIQNAPTECSALRDVVLEEFTLAEMGRAWTRYLLGSD